MKTVKKRRGLLFITGAITILALAGCSSQPLQSYPGQPRSLENIAVIVTGDNTCPVFCIDDEFRAPDNQEGREFHVLPGSHQVNVFCQRQRAYNAWYVDEVPVTCNLQAGHVYAIKKSQATDDSAELAQIDWTPHVQDLGSVVEYAQAHPKYGSSSAPWKQLRQDYGMTKSFWAFLKPDKKKEAQEQEGTKKSFWAFLKSDKKEEAQEQEETNKSFWAFLRRDKDDAEPENIAD